jgi:hypothetical protein
LLDRWEPPSREGVEWGQNTPEIAAHYNQHCLPNPTQVASRLNSIRTTSNLPLSHVFIATDAEPAYLHQLRDLLVADGWPSEGIVTSSELELNWQAGSVNMAVDTAIMSRAEVFVGNGVSFSVGWYGVDG